MIKAFASTVLILAAVTTFEIEVDLGTEHLTSTPVQTWVDSLFDLWMGCRPIPPVNNLDLDKFTGTWYQVAHTKSACWLNGLSNVVHKYKNRDNYWVDIETTLTHHGNTKTVTGTGRLIDGPKVGNFYVVFGDNWWQRFFMRALYKIAEVSYDSYHVVWFVAFKWYKFEQVSIVYARKDHTSQ